MYECMFDRYNMTQEQWDDYQDYLADHHDPTYEEYEESLDDEGDV